MSSLRKTFIRYKNLISKTRNWPDYLLQKSTGFSDIFVFDIKGFRKMPVAKKMLGPFRENFFDNVYFSRLPEKIFVGKKQPLIMDIGANVGFFSLAVFAKKPSAIVYAFEPHPFCFNTLANYKNIFPDLDLRILRKAVAKDKGVLTLFTSSSDQFSTTTTLFKNKKNVTGIEVETIRLQDFIAENNITTIDLLKLDCEGSEYPILYNLPSYCFDMIRNICIETHSGAGETETHEAMVRFIHEKGFSVKAEKKTNTGYIWAWK